MDGEKIDGNCVRKEVQVKIYLNLSAFDVDNFQKIKSLNFVFLRTRV